MTYAVESRQKIIDEFYRLSLVIESSVRFSEGEDSKQYKEVLKLVNEVNEQMAS